MAGDYFGIASIAPLEFRPDKFSDIIESVSSDFVEIYNQSGQAEALGLTTVSGPGYRKALEFLIKDYVIFKNPEKADAVKKMLLANVIGSYVDDPRIKKTASRATWLGNDETHYYRLWLEQDISDFKTLIQLAVRWIESVELTAQYEKEMP